MERAKAELTEYRRRKQQDRKDSRESKLPLFLEKS
jgi:molecular chaperone GrpE (heat shock protein)